MMTQAFYTGVSGIKSNQTAIDVTSNNIANISTTGFRAKNVEFSSLFEEAINSIGDSATSSIGKGTVVNSTSMVSGKGSMILTENSTDLSIDGDGWFGVDSGNNQTVYTRAGDFTFDANSDLTTTDGMYVLGTMAGNIEGSKLTQKVKETALGDISTQEKLRFPKSLNYPPKVTTKTEFIGSLDLKAEAKNIFTTSMVDSDNNQNILKLEFTKIDPQVLPGMQWNVTASSQNPDATTLYDTQKGIVKFDEKGGLLSSTLPSINNNGSDVSIDLGKGFDGIISNSSIVPVTNLSDGKVGGELVGYDINHNAEVIATFTNGEQSSVGKIALFHFQNNQGLNQLSSTKYSSSSNSGNPLFYTDGKGQNILGSKVSHYSLEGSNVDMAQSLTELIVLQRSFDSNSKVVSTANEMIQKALEM